MLINFDWSDYFNEQNKQDIRKKLPYKNFQEKYKEIVHPQVLLRIPCYDFSPVSSPTMDPHITRGASDITTSHAVTGGEYKTQEHIHRDISDSRLLAIPTSWSRVSDSNPDWDMLWRLAPPRGIAALCTYHCIMCVALGVKAMLIWRHPHLPPC